MSRDPGFTKAAAELRDLGEVKLKRALLKGMREAARPVGDSMVRGLSDRMPRRGGLSGVVAEATPVVRVETAGSSPKVSVRLQSPHDLWALDRGTLRHPVFGRRTWVTQAVPARGATEAFEQSSPRVRDSIAREVTAALQAAAARGSS